ncbi:hypothetical protein BWR13_12925 [Escherichia coli]|nr:hypothetical protein BWR13_12925 [Escherichia coli]
MTFRYPMLLTFLLMIFAFCVQGEPSLPQDVQHFLSNAEMCQHLAGEWDSSLPEKDKRGITVPSNRSPGGRRLTDKEMKDYGYQQQRAEVYCPQPRAPRAD